MRKTVLLSIWGLLFLTGCEKNSSNTPAATLSRLKQLSFSNITTSTTLPPGPAQVNFSYDAAGRVNTVFIHRGDSGMAVPASDSLCFISFSYTGSGTLPRAAFQRSRTGTGNMTTRNHTFFYDAGNQLARDSVATEPGGQTSYYLYRYGADYGISETGISPALPVKIDSFILINGNLVSLYEQNPPGPPQPVYSYRFENDNKLNPFNQMNIAGVFSSHGLNPKNPFNIYLEALLPVFGKNNATQVKIYADGSLTRTHTLWYTYNGEGLPVQRIWSYDNPITVLDTLTYKY